jgi:hypothetical protein
MEYLIVFFVALVIGMIIGYSLKKSKVVKGGRHGQGNMKNKQQ